ncbi:restriction endonuclease [Thermotoga sp. KOL6]|uniref:restriction endonuclease n=1 Tax=Thermotoga sp. KOL6 TaxID=126741 RepID=UPI000C77F3DC|nr:restriction endonuclease [Thermotoga sp. KOL6]PLV59913.1 restriction endonuclease [Thermotoga sp. KOL6]
MIPDYQTIMLPLLEFASDGKEHSRREAIDYLAGKFGLTEEERKIMLPSGQQTIFESRVGWAKVYLTKAGLLCTTRRGYFKITERGLEVLKNPPEKIDVKYLLRFPEFIEFRKKGGISKEESNSSKNTPEELIAIGYQRLRKELVAQLLDKVMSCSPSFFEKLVVDLLVKMGYGGSREEAGKAIGRTGDEGIDGIIKEDRLGLDIIYIQAKRWNNPVGRPEIQKFVGALHGQRAKKGVFITTSSFSKSAIEYVSKIDSKIILIDGEKLADLMIEYNVGVSTVATYEIKKIDLDYFTEE